MQFSATWLAACGITRHCHALDATLGSNDPFSWAKITQQNWAELKLADQSYTVPVIPEPVTHMTTRNRTGTWAVGTETRGPRAGSPLRKGELSEIFSVSSALSDFFRVIVHLHVQNSSSNFTEFYKTVCIAPLCYIHIFYMFYWLFRRKRGKGQGHWRERNIGIDRWPLPACPPHTPAGDQARNRACARPESNLWLSGAWDDARPLSHAGQAVLYFFWESLFRAATENVEGIKCSDKQKGFIILVLILTINR